MKWDLPGKPVFHHVLPYNLKINVNSNVSLYLFFVELTSLVIASPQKMYIVLVSSLIDISMHLRTKISFGD